MPRYTFVVLTNPVEGLEDEFNDWYTNTHLDDVLALPGYVAAQRFRFVAKDPDQKPEHKYMALYEVETDDLWETHAQLVETARTDAMPFSPGIDDSTIVGLYYEPITERVTQQPKQLSESAG
jgi:hypothetical protein